MPTVAKAAISKFHSLFLTPTGTLFGCGHSKEGRLGVGSEATLTSPQEIERIAEVSAGMSHSLIMTNKAVYAAGSNKHLQLGIEGEEVALSFKEVTLDVDSKSMLGIIACDYHSLFVTRSGVLVCGLNVGQFGGIQEVRGVDLNLNFNSLVLIFSPSQCRDGSNIHNCRILKSSGRRATTPASASTSTTRRRTSSTFTLRGR